MAEKRWYVVHVYSGFEKKIAQQIKEQAAQKGLGDAFVYDVMTTRDGDVWIATWSGVNCQPVSASVRR